MSVLAKLFSTIDSARRILKDRLSDPAADIRKTVARASEDASAFRETQKAGGPAATEAMLNAVLNMTTPGMAGVIVPAQLLNYGASQKAAKLIAAGKDKEAWNLYKVYKDPADSKLKSVLSDAGAKFKPGTVKGSAPLSTFDAGPSGWWELAGSGRLEDVLDHPELKKYLPGIYHGTTVSKSPTVGGGGFSPSTGNIEVGPTRVPKSQMEILLHEIQHAIQQDYNFSKGGNPVNFIKDNTGVAGVERAIRQISSTNNKQLTPATYLTMDSLQRAAAAPGREAFKRYSAVPGEVEARIVERMFRTGNYDLNPAETAVRMQKLIGPMAPHPYADQIPEFEALKATLQDLGYMN